jgi:hypothetical protein
MEINIQLNGKMFVTDEETANLLMSVVPQAVATNDFSAAWAIMEIGLKTGRIREAEEAPKEELLSTLDKIFEETGLICIVDRFRAAYPFMTFEKVCEVYDEWKETRSPKDEVLDGMIKELSKAHDELIEILEGDRQ